MMRYSRAGEVSLLCDFSDPYAGMTTCVYKRNDDGLPRFVADCKQHILTFPKILRQSRQPFFPVFNNFTPPPMFNRLTH